MNTYWVTYYDRRNLGYYTGLVYGNNEEEAKETACRLFCIEKEDIKKIEL